VAKFVKGDVVVVPFPYSDLSRTKRRPALVIAKLRGDDLILCQITSQSVKDDYAIPLSTSDFLVGDLNLESNIRTNRVFSADSDIVIYKVGSVKPEKMKNVTDRLIQILIE
jgi:mRNA interferase MazF